MSRNLSLLQLSLLKTLVYFDCLDRALTATEIFWYLARVRPTVIASEGRPKQSRVSSNNHEIAAPPPREEWARNDEPTYSFLDVLKVLESGSLLREKFIEEKNGYYFLKGRSHLYEERIERLKIADQWWKKMRRVARWMMLVPYVRLVMASGSLGMQHMTWDSDLDVLVVLKHGRIWTGRFLLTALLHFLGVRRHGKYVAGRVCLNHYITDQSLHIPFHSLYNAMTYAQLIPIYEMQPSSLRAPKGRGNLVLKSQNGIASSAFGGLAMTVEFTSLFYQFQSANLWIKDYLLNWQPGGENLRTLKPSRWRMAIARFFEWCLDSVWGDWLERLLRRLQLRRIQRRPETYTSGGRVRADDMMLEFHPDSPERTILDRFNKKIAELELGEWGYEKDSGLAGLEGGV